MSSSGGAPAGSAVAAGLHRTGRGVVTVADRGDREVLVDQQVHDLDGRSHAGPAAEEPGHALATRAIGAYSRAKISSASRSR